MKTKVIVLGSTGSVGTQALEVLAEHRDFFEVVALGAGGSRVRLLSEQQEYFPEAITIVGNNSFELANNNIANLIKDTEADVVLNAIDGFAGLLPSMATLQAGKKLALANKETMIFGGNLIKSLANKGQIIPVDSEHSAIFQCLKGEHKAEASKLILTASGGPFRGFTKEQLEQVTEQQVLAHPTWDMGKNISLNSATLVNKGLEVIEAHYLFDFAYQDIEVVVHPESIVHSMVSFQDGTTLLQAAIPSMKLPISYALGFPNRLANIVEPLDFQKLSQLNFEPINGLIFPAVELAKQVGELGGLYPAIFTASNEQFSQGFFNKKITYAQIVPAINEVVDIAISTRKDFTNDPENLTDILAAVNWARDTANSLLERI